MVRLSDPSNAERKIMVPVQKPRSNTGKRPADQVLYEIYENNYLIEDKGRANQGDYLVHSAELKCSAQSGTKKAFLKLNESVESYGRKKIGHGANINGLPQANKTDCKAGVNIGSFGECSLLKYETAEVQKKIRDGAKSRGVDVCTYIRNIISQWITPLESELMEIGGEKAITTGSWLLCDPTKISAYRGQGISIGKIQAKNSGQGNLDALLKEYKEAYNIAYNEGIKTVNNIFSSFNSQQVYEYVFLYEIRYPERERAFQNFFRKANIDLYLDDILKMKCMTYMLKNENITKKMLEYMSEYNGIYIKINNEPDTAYYSNSITEGRFINYPHIVEVRGYNPAYKTYFHEFGHSIDHAFGGKKGYYSETFRNTQKAEEYTLTFNEEIKKVEVLKKERVLTKTIHEWAELDVRNCLIESACVVLRGESTYTEIDYENQPYINNYRLVQEVINNCLLVWNGEIRSEESHSKNIEDLYKAIKLETEEKFASKYGIPCLPSDIFASITGAQIGGGHDKKYWFYIEGKRKGERKREVSMEAFAGYFEYTTLGIELAINPQNVIPYTVLALEEMLNQIL